MPVILHRGARAAHYPEMPLRCTRRILALLAVFAASHALAANNGTTILRVGLDSQSATTNSSYKIGIDGSAPAGCVPHVEDVTLDGADLSLVLAAPATGCKPQRPVPFHLKTDPAAATGMPRLPAQVYHVRVYSGSEAAPQLAAFALIDTSTPALSPVPESGFWWTQAGADGVAAGGTGMSLELQENQLAASLLGFADSGAATWYFGSSALSGHVARIPLVQLANGDEWFSAIGTLPDVQPGPRLEIEFLSPTRARAYLVRTGNSNDLQVRSLTLSRSAFSTGPAGTSWVGRWVLIPDDGGSARLFDFSGPSNRDAENFRLVDTANDAALDCRLVAGTQQADACTLSASASPIADFDQVGYDHFSGHGVNGAPVQLLRVPR
jgi:hypothetical protein